MNQGWKGLACPTFVKHVMALMDTKLLYLFDIMTVVKIVVCLQQISGH